MFGKEKREKELEKKLEKKLDQRVKDDQRILDEKKEKKKKRKKKIFIISILTIIFLFLSTIVYISYIYFFKLERYTSKQLDHVKLKEEILIFTYDNMLTIYKQIVLLNDEATIIQAEIARLEDIEKQFPDQKRIISSEKKKWDKLKKTILSVIAKTEKEIELLYVTYKVNKDKGLELIKEKQQEINTLLKETLTASKEQTISLVEKENKKNLLQKVKQTFLKFKQAI